MNMSHWLVASAFAGCAVLIACSSTSSGGGTNYGSYTSCISQGASSDCVTCVENSCGTPLSNIESSCTSYWSCACPGGNYDATAANSSTCTATLTGNTACVNATDGFSSCVNTSCATQCGTLDGGTDGSTDDGSSGDGAAATACGIGYASASCATCVTSGCCTQSNACANDTACVGIITCQGPCANNDTTCLNNCVTSASSSAQTEFNNLQSCLQTSCANNGC
jgi:hypothetical protein